MAMGLASAGGSLGQVLMIPLAQAVTDHRGLSTSLFVLAFVMLAAAPLGIVLDRRDPGAAPVQEPAPSSLREASWRRRCRHRGYRLLTLGFFTCGFQLAFIATHLPGYLTLCHMPIGLGATALALIGLFNMVGKLGMRLARRAVPPATRARLALSDPRRRHRARSFCCRRAPLRSRSSRR